MMESPLERQESELEVLKSIFDSSLIDNRTHDRLTNVTIQLEPLLGSRPNENAHVSIQMQIICSENYPETIPIINLLKPKGLSEKQVTDLKLELEKLAASKVGEVMIFELAHHVQTFLHQHNKPGSKSFYEEMLSRRQKEEKTLLEKNKLMENMKRLAIQKEIQEKVEVIRVEARNRKELRFSDSSYENDCNHKNVRDLKFTSNGRRTVHRGTCLGHSSSGSVVFAGLDSETGDILAIREWTVKSNMKNISTDVKKLSEELSELKYLHHENIVRYIDMNYICDKEETFIYIAQDCVFGLNLKNNLNKIVDVRFARHVAEGVLLALYYLQGHNKCHESVKLSSIFIDKTGSVKLGNHCIYRRLCAFTNTLVYDNPNLAADDVEQLGQVVLKLLTGLESKNIPDHLPAEVKDFLSRCLHTDSRFTIKQLLEHRFIKPALEKIVFAMNKRVPPMAEAGDSASVDDNSKSYEINIPKVGKGFSRFQSEFKVLDKLGSGAYGTVYKAKNNLDRRIYAVKEIKINPDDQINTKRLTREVETLSKLNHENVVRYFNSWFETKVVKEIDDSSKSSIQESTLDQDSLAMFNSIEKDAPPMKEVEWISSNLASRDGGRNEESSDSETSDDENSESESSTESDNIEFEKELQTSESSVFGTESKSNKTTTETCSLSPSAVFMFIQMEFCEKSTLRHAIDNNIYEDVERVWRLFREIVEGLSHIHQQGIIHRDLKPVNIFLDVNDHVKIGDFGLATTRVVKSHNLMVMKDIVVGGDGDLSIQTLTGRVGTSLYAAPEIDRISSKLSYSEKVDIYSLGIIFFEMCYHPLSTKMEHLKILTDLRTREVLTPEDFSQIEMSNQLYIIKWLLNHDANLRPTSDEILQSNYLPPPLLEETDLQEMVRHTLSNPQSRAYKHLIASCLEQDISAAEDVTYHSHTPIISSSKPLLLHELVKETIIRIFKKHGAVSFPTPLLTPKSSNCSKSADTVFMMTHSGSIVSIPYDLRVPFIRYVAMNKIANLRRYTVDRVYRERKVYGLHPRELYECAMDIVTPHRGGCTSDSELLAVVCDIFNEFPTLRNKNFYIRINHSSILKALFMYSGVEEENSVALYKVLGEIKDEKSSKAGAEIMRVCKNESVTKILCNIIKLEESVNKIQGSLQQVLKRKAEKEALKEGLKELKMIVAQAELLGVKVPIVVCPGLVYNTHQFSGMMFQFGCRLKQKKRRGFDIMAAGCRYDQLLTSYRDATNFGGQSDVAQAGVGISVALDKIITWLNDEQDEIEEQDDMSNVDVVVSMLGQNSIMKEMFQIIRDMWNAGLKAHLLENMETLEEIQSYCSEWCVSYIVLLKESEKGLARIRTLEKDTNRYQEKKIKIEELVEYLQKNLKANYENTEVRELPPPRLDTRCISVSETHSMTTPNNFNIQIVPDETKQASVRRWHENHIKSHLSGILHKFSSKSCIEVIAVFLDIDVITCLVTSCFILDEDVKAYKRSVEKIIEKYPRHKKYIIKICGKLEEVDKDKSVIILYSINDSCYRTLI